MNTYISLQKTVLPGADIMDMILFSAAFPSGEERIQGGDEV